VSQLMVAFNLFGHLLAEEHNSLHSLDGTVLVRWMRNTNRCRSRIGAKDNVAARGRAFSRPSAPALLLDPRNDRTNPGADGPPTT